MSQDDTPDLATPQADKMAPEAVALRAQPRPVTRLNRRSLAILAGVLAVAVLGALIGAALVKRVPDKALEKGFGWFVLAMGLVILVRELIGLLV